jgi:hypothetical protein
MLQLIDSAPNSAGREDAVGKKAPVAWFMGGWQHAIGE